MSLPFTKLYLSGSEMRDEIFILLDVPKCSVMSTRLCSTCATCGARCHFKKFILEVLYFISRNITLTFCKPPHGNCNFNFVEVISATVNFI